MIKVCGMRNADNIIEVSSLGADIIGLIFYHKSPRYVGKLTSPLPNGIAYAGVFVNEEPEIILKCVRTYALSYVQLHGNENATYIKHLRIILPSKVKIIKAISISKDSNIRVWEAYKDIVDLLLFDTQCTGYGGSGEKFDWHILDKYDGTIPFLLSGGIGPEDAEQIKKYTHPLCIGIDLNSRFESAPGIKDTEQIENFIRVVKAY